MYHNVLLYSIGIGTLLLNKPGVSYPRLTLCRFVLFGWLLCQAFSGTCQRNPRGWYYYNKLKWGPHSGFQWFDQTCNLICIYLFIYLCIYLFIYVFIYLHIIFHPAIFLQYHPSQVWHALRLRMFASIYTWKRWLKHRHLPPRSTELPHEEVQSNPCLGLRGSGWLIATGSMEKPGLKPELLKLGGSMFKPRTLTLSSYSSSGFP